LYKFSAPLGLKWGFGDKIGKGWCDSHPHELVFTFGGSYVTSVPILVKIDQEMRQWECPQTDTQTDRHTGRCKPVL